MLERFGGVTRGSRKRRGSEQSICSVHLLQMRQLNCDHFLKSFQPLCILPMIQFMASNNKNVVWLRDRNGNMNASRQELINEEHHLNTILITFNQSKPFKRDPRLTHSDVSHTHHTLTYFFKVYADRFADEEP